VDTFREMEPEFDDFFRQAARKEQEELQREGVQIVRLPEPEASKLLELVDEALWSKIERDSPDFARKLREALATVPKT
jgi:TRAP-type C4-dicarboxylate transport system substrate-binding protein